MSDLSDKLTRMADRNLREAPMDAELMKQAAKRIEELESCQGRIDIHNLEVENKRLNSRLEDCWREQRKHADEMDRILEDLRIEKDKLESAEKVIEDIAKAAECDNFADIIIARVTSLAQQTNAMTRICEGHIATSRKAEARLKQISDANDAMAANLEAVKREREDLKNQLLHRSDLLHAIADVLGAGSRNEVPAREWYMAKINELRKGSRPEQDMEIERITKNRRELSNMLDKVLESLCKFEKAIDVKLIQPSDMPSRLNALRGFCVDRIQELKGLQDRMIEKNAYIEKLEKCPDKAWLRVLEDAYRELERMRNRIAAANARWGIKVADPVDYPRQLDYLIDEIEVWRNKATKVQDELDLGVAAIKRMYAKLQLAKMDTGIWPDDGRFRAKLDDIEWCLNVYISKYIKAMNLHAADTSFLGNVRDSLQHEIQRRSGK